MRFLILPVVLLSIAGCSEGLKPTEAAAPGEAAPVEAPALAAPEAVSVLAELPPLAATLSETAPAAGLANGGSIDGVTLDTSTNTITIYGWVQVKSAEAAPELKVYAPGALSAGPIVRLVREDVSTALNDPDLRYSGYDLKIQVSPGTPLTDLCITTNDSVYGETILAVHPGVMPSCSVPAQTPPT